MKRLTIDIPEEFADKCEEDNVSPQRVLEDFIRSLCGLPGSGGSDERGYAWMYYERRGYGWGL